ncbi:MAG: SpoIIE family protein phosphatase [Firmicutes bacterium]|nr:SpoIIE family protein phosphatase [Bacillota bacterium]
MNTLFVKLIGTLAVILVVASIIGGSNLLHRFFGNRRSWKYVLIAGLLGGIFGIYGNISGIDYNGAVISVRDIGPMLAGFIGGPWGGLLGGLIAGAHRYTMGGITAEACIIATCCIGTMCGLLSDRYHERMIKPWMALLIGAAMEVFHLCIVLLMVRPFETALDIVQSIALPFIIVNAVGFTLMMAVMAYIENQRTMTMERSRLQSELEVATIIQQSLLPPISDTYPGRPEFDIRGYMRPAKQVGGDFYDVFFLTPDKIAFLIADVSGKGIPAALFMASAKITLQNCVRDFIDLSESIRLANDSLCNNNEAEMFVTAWIGILDIPTGEVDFVCAGHNPPVLITGQGPEYIRHRGGFVLGGMEGLTFRPQHLDLKQGDVLFLYTDGVTEAENAANDLYGEERLENLLSSLKTPDADSVIETVRKDVADFVGGVDPSDDMTMLCIRMN